MKLFELLTLISALAFVRPALAGNDHGTGGDTVECRAASDSSYEGIYALDYLLTLGGTGRIVDISSWESSQKRIEKNLRRVSPFLAESFAEYVKYLDNHSDYTAPRIWEASPFGLIELDDQKSIRKLPKNCYVQKSAGVVQVLQTVIRQVKPESVLYTYDPEVFTKLRPRPLQLSFLLVHEWLWDLTSDVQALRRMNLYLHSEDFDRIDEAGFAKILPAMGFGSGPDLSVCDRTPEIRRQLEAITRLRCDAIEPRDLQEVVNLDLSHLSSSRLKLGDFSGLSACGSLRLFGSALEGLPAWALHPLSSVRELSLGSSRISKVYPGTFDGLDFISELDLSGNQLAEVPEPLVSGKRRCPREINLSRNRLSTLPLAFLPGSACNSTISGVTVKLEENAIREIPDAVLEKLKTAAEALPYYAGTSLILTGNPISQAEQRRASEWLANHPCKKAKQGCVALYFGR